MSKTKIRIKTTSRLILQGLLKKDRIEKYDVFQHVDLRVETTMLFRPPSPLNIICYFDLKVHLI